MLQYLLHDFKCNISLIKTLIVLAFKNFNQCFTSLPGRVITAYRIRKNSWKLLGKGDPHAPQVFIYIL